jgi:hypothetical protein
MEMLYDKFHKGGKCRAEALTQPEEGLAWLLKGALMEEQTSVGGEGGRNPQVKIRSDSEI